MNNYRKVHVFERVDYMSLFAVQLWLEISFNAVRDKGFFAVALSGGKTPIDFYEQLSSRENRLPWSETHIFLVDERFIPLNDKDSNFRSIKENLLSSLELSRDNIHHIPTEEETSLLSAKKYEKELKTFFKTKEDVFPEFDLIMLGIGEDGHTASLFPEDVALQEKKHLAVAVKNGKVKHERISITMPVINNAKNVVFLVSGANKAHIMKKITARQDRQIPASHVCPINGRLFFLMDKEAGKHVKI